MRVFLTSATGYIGSHVAAELLRAGHAVSGLARTDNAAAALLAVGMDARRGDLQDLDGLRRGAAAADAVIHLAFGVDFSKFKEISEIDRHAIAALGSTIAGTGKALIVPNGLAGLRPRGEVAIESDGIPAGYPFPRVSEQEALGFASRGVRACVVRLAQVHDARKLGLITRMIAVARRAGVSAYVGDGSNRWSAAHVADVASLFRLVLEKGEAGARYHAVAEEAIAVRPIAESIGRGLGVPVRSLSPEEAPVHFGPLAMFVGGDILGSGAKTRERLGWHPTGPGLIADLERVDFAASAPS